MDDRILRELETLGFWGPGMELDPIEWFPDQSPPHALDGLAAYRLVDPGATPTRDRAGRNWIPVLDDGTGVSVGPSPDMLATLLERSGYFERPDQFGRQLLIQFHRLALDFYQGYQVREDGFVYDDGELVVTGEATRGMGHRPLVARFETRVRRGGLARFSVS